MKAQIMYDENAWKISKSYEEIEFGIDFKSES